MVKGNTDAAKDESARSDDYQSKHAPLVESEQEQGLNSQASRGKEAHMVGVARHPFDAFCAST